jgi:hypothetical protein
VTERGGGVAGGFDFAGKVTSKNYQNKKYLKGLGHHMGNFLRSMYKITSILSLHAPVFS